MTPFVRFHLLKQIATSWQIRNLSVYAIRQDRFIVILLWGFLRSKYRPIDTSFRFHLLVQHSLILYSHSIRRDFHTQCDIYMEGFPLGDFLRTNIANLFALIHNHALLRLLFLGEYRAGFTLEMCQRLLLQVYLHSSRVRLESYHMPDGDCFVVED